MYASKKSRKQNFKRRIATPAALGLHGALQLLRVGRGKHGLSRGVLRQRDANQLVQTRPPVAPSHHQSQLPVSGWLNTLVARRVSSRQIPSHDPSPTSALRPLVREVQSFQHWVTRKRTRTAWPARSHSAPRAPQQCAPRFCAQLPGESRNPH